MVKEISSLFLIAIFFSCIKPEGKYKIDPKDFGENEITLSELADDIKYLTLDNSIPIGLVYKLKITRDFIFISIKDVGILKFDRSGKMVCRIGALGRGPGEYQHFMDFAIDEASGNVYVMGPGTIKVYSRSGRFVRDIAYSQYINFVGGDIEIYNSMLFIPDYISTGKSENCWIFLDTLGKLISRKKNSIPTFQTEVGVEGSIYRFGDEMFYYNWFNDTIFSISPDLNYQEAYLFAKGDHRWPTGKVNWNSQASKLFKPGKMFETEHFILLQYSYFHKYAMTLIDKSSKMNFLAIKYVGKHSEPCLLNDLDYGPDLKKDINYYAEDTTEYFVQLISPVDIKKHLSSEKFRNSEPAYPEKKTVFDHLVNNLKETDNPVLMMVRLKN
jgi:hypothetical protein